jgi:hypothetical protein
MEQLGSKLQNMLSSIFRRLADSTKIFGKDQQQ